MEALLVDLHPSRNNVARNVSEKHPNELRALMKPTFTNLPYTTWSMLGVMLCAVTTFFGLFDTALSTY